MPLFSGNAPQSIIYPTATTPVVVATAVGITLSAFFSGSNVALTYIAFPALLLPPPDSAGPAKLAPDSDTKQAGTPPAHLARQWQKLSQLGTRTLPVVALGSLGAYLYAYAQLPENMSTQRSLFVVAAALSVSVAPYTYLVMQNTQNELTLRADAATKDGESEEAHPENIAIGEQYQTQGLIKYWGGLNGVRATLPLASIACAVSALVY